MFGGLGFKPQVPLLGQKAHACIDTHRGLHICAGTVGCMRVYEVLSLIPHTPMKPQIISGNFSK